MDLTKPLPEELEIEREDGHLCLLAISYQWLPPLCSICNEIGHKASLCPKDQQDPKPTTNPKGKDSKQGKNKERPKKQSLVWVPITKISEIPSTMTDSTGTGLAHQENHKGPEPVEGSAFSLISSNSAVDVDVFTTSTMPNTGVSSNLDESLSIARIEETGSVFVAPEERSVVLSKIEKSANSCR